MADEKKRVLVTGSNGCIGAATVKWLLANGADEVVGLNRSEPEPTEDARHRNLQCDVTAAEALQEILGEFRPSHVVHLAAYAFAVVLCSGVRWPSQV